MSIVPNWMRSYQKSWLSGDVVAGVIVTVMLGRKTAVQPAKPHTL